MYPYQSFLEVHMKREISPLLANTTPALDASDQVMIMRSLVLNSALFQLARRRPII